jgi:hypothetical protein
LSVLRDPVGAEPLVASSQLSELEHGKDHGDHDERHDDGDDQPGAGGEDGDRCGRRPGIDTIDDLPQVLNPAAGFIQNCNSTPYTTTDNAAAPHNPTNG